MVEKWNQLCPKCESYNWDVLDSYPVDDYEWTKIQCNECNYKFGLKTIQILCEYEE